MQLNRISRTFIYEAFHENKQQDKGKKQNNSKEFKIKGSSKIRIGFILKKKRLQEVISHTTPLGERRETIGC